MPPESAALRSAIYSGRVLHHRYGTPGHTLDYRVFYLLLDLDELPQVATLSAWLGWNKPAWFSFYDKDHGDGDGRAFKDWLRGLLEQAGLRAPRWRFQLLCMPRVLGYVFNPISVIYCEREDGTLGAMVYEVNNTFGERLSYVVPVQESAARTIRQWCDKALFVSPFFDMQGGYHFKLNRPDDRLQLSIDYHADGEHRLRALFHGERSALTASNLRRLAWRYPLATVKVMAGIHYEALKLWLKRAPLVRHVARGPQHYSTGSGS